MRLNLTIQNEQFFIRFTQFGALAIKSLVGDMLFTADLSDELVYCLRKNRIWKKFTKGGNKRLDLEILDKQLIFIETSKYLRAITAALLKQTELILRIKINIYVFLLQP